MNSESAWLLGAARTTIFRQLLTESVALSCIGGVAGAGMAVMLVQAAGAKLPDSLPRLSGIEVSWPLFFAAIVLTAATGLICGIAPAVEVCVAKCWTRFEKAGGMRVEVYGTLV